MERGWRMLRWGVLALAACCRRPMSCQPKQQDEQATLLFEASRNSFISRCDILLGQSIPHLQRVKGYLYTSTNHPHALAPPTPTPPPLQTVDPHLVNYNHHILKYTQGCGGPGRRGLE